MKKVLKFVKGKKENGSITPSQSGDLTSSPQTPENEAILGLNYSPTYTVDFSGRDKTVTKLHKAAWQGNLDKVKSALKKIEIDAVDRRNRTALHFAVVQGHPSIVWFLLGNNAKTTVCDENGYTPLLKSIEFNHKECMALLMERGADVNAADFNGNTGLHIASKLAALDTVSSLLSNNANPEISNNAGDYPLHIATKLENNDLLEILLCHGASVDVTDRENRTPLMIAAKNGSFAVVDLLCKYGAQLNIVDSNGWTAEDYALLGSHEKIAQLIKSLLKNMKGKFGGTEKNEVEGFGFDKLKEDNVLRRNTLMEEMKAEPPGSKVVDKVELFQKRPGKSGETVEKEKHEETPDSPNAEVMPPYCKPPKSWEMIQAGMIDQNNDGNESKRRSITTLGTLHSRRGSFAEGLTVISPKHTLSLNRRKHVKINNSFAKHRFSFNEEESLKQWTNDGKKIRKDLEKIEVEDMRSPEAVDIPNGSPRQKKLSNVERRRNNDGSALLGKQDTASTPTTSVTNIQNNHSDVGTLGRHETMKEVEEIWISNETQLSPTVSKSKEENEHKIWDSGQLNTEKNVCFPSPPSDIELGIDMAKSKKYMKGISEDPTQSDILERNLWNNPNQSHSFDYFEDIPKVKTFKGHFRQESSSHENWITEEISKCQKPCNKMTDVNRRIREELECYDDALRELAESSASGNFSVPTFYGLNTDLNVPNGSKNSQTSISNKKSNIETLDKSSSGSSSMRDKSADLESSRKNEVAAKSEEIGLSEPEEKQGKKTKKQILLAMREVKHEEGIMDTLSLLEKSGENAEVNHQSESKVFRENTLVIGNSPPASKKLDSTEPNRKKSALDAMEISTSALQEDFQKAIINSDCQSPTSDSDISEEKDVKHQRTFSFSPLGAIYKEIVKERENAEQYQSDTSCPDSRGASSIENVCNAPSYHDELAVFGSTLEEHLANLSNQEDEEYHDDRELSPDASLSSGPIEPLGLEKDSGSEPDSSINDITPTHKYFLKVQHEWLKCHLKVATEEKSKLEGLAAQLSEKAERLQFELEDAKAATKSREEVIQLLQGHLTRMEIAYSKCLQESVQCRLELTAHEQEIHHLKQICSKYEEQRDKVVQEAIGQDFERLQLRIITLEEEKEKMKQEILHLEQEKGSLEKRFRKMAESETSDQQWKERYTRVENLTGGKYYTGKSHLKEINEELKSMSYSKHEQPKAIPGSNDSAAESTRESPWMRMDLENVEEVTEEKLKNKRNGKDVEMENSVEKLSRERDCLIKSRDKELLEKKSKREGEEVEIFYKENERIKNMVVSIRDRVENIRKLSVEDVKETLKSELKNQCDIMSKALEKMHNREQSQLKSLMKKSHELKKKLNKLSAKIRKENRDVSTFKTELFETVCKNTKVKNEILDLKSQVNLFRLLLERTCCLWIDFRNENKSHNSSGNLKSTVFSGETKKILNNIVEVKDAVKETVFKKRKDFIEDDWDWPPNESFGVHHFSKGENLYELNITTKQDCDTCGKCGQKQQLLQIKKDILFLKKQVLLGKRKNPLRSEVAQTDLNLKLKDNRNLEREIESLKEKINKNCKLRSDMELLRHRKDLEWKQKNYLESLGEEEGKEIHRKLYESFAKERERSKEIIKKTIRPPKSFCLLDEKLTRRSQLRFPSWVYPQSSWQTELTGIPFILQPEIKYKLEGELNKSVLKYSTSERKENCEALDKLTKYIYNKSILSH